MMPKFKQAIYATLVVAPLACVSADSDPLAPPQAAPSIMPYAPAANESAFELPGTERKLVPTATAPSENVISPFTGKIRGKKVRMRLDADLDSRIIRELNKNDLIAVVGEKGNFYAVQAPAESKAYVFRSFVLDDVIEGNRVNIRLEPDLEAPVIGHFNGGEQINSTVCAKNNKWLEIAVPQHVHFYVAKDFVENIGGPEFKDKMDKRKNSLRHSLDTAETVVKAELKKAYDEIDVDRLTHQFEKLVADSADFPDISDKAAEAQRALQDELMHKKLAYLESKATQEALEEVSIQEETLAVENTLTAPKATDKMLYWQPIEEALYANWATMNHNRNIHEYYNDQKMIASKISGIVEAYTAPVRNKPGDFILKDKDLPVAYVYSTKVNLQDYVGKRVSLVAVPRPNNNFAFPAYFVLSQE